MEIQSEVGEILKKLDKEDREIVQGYIAELAHMVWKKQKTINKLRKDIGLRI